MDINDNIFAYCASNIEDFELQYGVALKRIDHMRCPLRMADPILYSEIEARVEDWCLDNDVDFDDIDIEEIFL